MTRPPHVRHRLSALLPALTCAVGLGGGCLAAAPMPDDVAPDDELHTRDAEGFEPAPAASAATAPEEAEAGESSVHAAKAEASGSICVDDCLVSATPHTLAACEGEAAFDDCASTCAVDHCPNGDVSYDDDILELGITTRGDGWVPGGCDDATAWSHCVFECAATTHCPDGSAPSHLCNLECLAETLDVVSEQHAENEGR